MRCFLYVDESYLNVISFIFHKDSIANMVRTHFSHLQQLVGGFPPVQTYRCLEIVGWLRIKAVLSTLDIVEQEEINLSDSVEMQSSKKIS